MPGAWRPKQRLVCRVSSGAWVGIRKPPTGGQQIEHKSHVTPAGHTNTPVRAALVVVDARVFVLQVRELFG